MSSRSLVLFHEHHAVLRDGSDDVMLSEDRLSSEQVTGLVPGTSIPCPAIRNAFDSAAAAVPLAIVM
jgi:hypothetical protein